jgi:hypothetical protein
MVRVKNWICLHYVFNELKNNEEIVINAVIEDGLSLKCVFNEFKNNMHLIF